MRFEDWFDESGLTESEAGDKCGVSRSYVARLRRGARPGDQVKVKIEKGTGGKVAWADWKPELVEDHATVNEPTDTPGLHHTDTNCGAAS